jgi:tetratricopeptide (TPR) repeat protein
MCRLWISLITMAGSVSAAGLPNPGLSRAEELYARTEYRRAIDTLEALGSREAASHVLLGKAYFMEGLYKQAADNLEKAVAEDSLNSDSYDWLGRAYGRLAERSSFLTALKYARKTVRAFEHAVELGASNLEALSDLFEFYLQAPGMVGGGADKAEAIARRFAALNEAEYHWACARLAEKRKDPAAAEREYRAALEAAPNEVGRALDLAAFLASCGRYSESDALFRSAAEQHPDSPKVLYARAAVYVQSRRKLNEAETLLERYLHLQTTPDDPTRREAAELMRSAQNLRPKSRQAE